MGSPWHAHLGVTASVCANILHAHDNPIAQPIAAWQPLA
jgi:hypothetical protein